MQELSDSDFGKARQGNLVAFEKIVHLNEQMVYGIALRMLGSAEDSSDITQEVFLRAFRNLHSFNNAPHLKKWLCRVTNNLCMDELRRRKHVLGRISPNESNTSPDKNPENDTPIDQHHKDLENAIARLSGNDKMMIILRDLHNLSYSEIAEVTRTNIGIVKSRLYRARSRLKTILDDVEKQPDTTEQANPKLVIVDKKGPPKE